MSDNTLCKAKSESALGARMPESLVDRFMLCPVCREECDMRDPGEVLQHLHATVDDTEND